MEQIQELGSDQVNSISEAQQSSLSSEKLAVFNNVSQVNQTVDTSSLTQTTQAPTTTPVQSAAGDTVSEIT